MEKEKLAVIAPGRLSELLFQGLRGHHPLFERAEILAAFDEPDAPIAREDANDIGQVLLTICKDSVEASRSALATLPAAPRLALIRLYFRLLDRAQEEQPLRH
jgi:hypothetical protein